MARESSVASKRCISGRFWDFLHSVSSFHFLFHYSHINPIYYSSFHFLFHYSLYNHIVQDGKACPGLLPRSISSALESTRQHKSCRPISAPTELVPLRVPRCAFVAGCLQEKGLDLGSCPMCMTTGLWQHGCRSHFWSACGYTSATSFSRVL